MAFLSLPSHLDAFISSEAEWQLAREKIFNGRSGTVLEIFFGFILCNSLKSYLYLVSRCLIVQHKETFAIQ